MHMHDGMRRTTRIIAVAAVLTLLPLQIVIMKVWGRDPYPALTQPEFAGPGPIRDGEVRASALTLTVTFVDGTRADVRPSDLLPGTGGLDETAILAMTFSDPAATTDPATVSWIAARLQSLFPARPAQTLHIRWARTATTLDADAESRVTEVRFETTIVVMPR
jgi:hypothetical protein